MVKECRSIAKAQSGLKGKARRDFDKSLNDLNKILVNPVTLPRRREIKYIPNILNAYYDFVYDEQLIYGSEHIARKHIDEILLKDDDSQV